MKRVTIVVISDIATDQRVQKVAGSLHSNGYAVTVIGRQVAGGMSLPELPFRVKRLRLMFQNGPLMYACFNIRLFFQLLFIKSDIINANDLDTLPAAWFSARIKGSAVVYDSHEFFTGVPEIQSRPIVKNTWLLIERCIFPKIKHIYTVNQSIATIYRRKYRKKVQVIRNLPRRDRKMPEPASRKSLSIPEDKRILILQGSGINIDRGAEEAVAAMKFLNNTLLLVIGSGDVIPLLRKQVRKNDLQNNVQILRRMPYENLMQYTRIADLGLTLDKNTNPNYRFSLPNKLFDYIQAGIPVLSSKLPEIEKILKKYDIGDTINTHKPAKLAAKISEIFENFEKYDVWKKNLPAAARELCWENEEAVLLEIYQKALHS